MFQMQTELIVVQPCECTKNTDCTLFKGKFYVNYISFRKRIAASGEPSRSA